MYWGCLTSCLWPHKLVTSVELPHPLYLIFSAVAWAERWRKPTTVMGWKLVSQWPEHSKPQEGGFAICSLHWVPQARAEF